MLDENISPKYLMEIIPKVSEQLWGMFSNARYQNVRRYIEKWHTQEWISTFDVDENFHIYFKDEQNREIDLDETLHRMSHEILIKIAIDLGVDTPGFLPLKPSFKNILKDNNQSAYQNFTRAASNVYKDPDNSVALAASTLEGIIKTILEHETFANDLHKFKNLPLTKLVNEIIKRFKLADENAPKEVFTLAKQLAGIGGTLDDLRSDKSTAHGKGSNDYVVDDPLWAIFAVNTVTGVGLFLWEYFQAKYIPKVTLDEPSTAEQLIDIDDRPIDLSEIPF